MEQLQQLTSIRDAAEKRLEDARAALERSPDAKLVASLSLLIDDLKASFAADGQAESGYRGAAGRSSAPVQPVEEDMPAADAGRDAAHSAADGFSLEDSLEAELLKIDS
ncbi:MAG: hypothetical protein KDJ80_01420 [Nitratireductor sp.]|nr:hypothetical protein [Nitratireductor sp.]